MAHLQLPLWAPTSEWRPPAISSLPSWRGAGRIGLDIETCDPDLKNTGPGVRRGGYIAGVSFAIEDGPKHYLPMRHEMGGNLDPVEVMRYIKAQCKTFDGIIVGANLQYELDYLWEAGVEFPEVKFFRDVQVAAPLINELELSYSLENLLRRAGMEGKTEDMLRAAAQAHGLDPKKDLHRLHSKYVGAYAEDDSDKPLRLLRKLEREIDEQELWNVYDLESRVLPVLVRMRRRGIRINQDKLAQFSDWTEQMESEALAFVRAQTGIRINVGDVWKAELLGSALRQIGVAVPVTAKGKSSVKADYLDSIDHPVAEALKKARKVNKLRTTFVQSIRDHMVDGRIHATFNQLRTTDDDEGDSEEGGKGARYGRLSSDTPNLQQQPSRDEYAKEWRKIYIPEPGQLLAAPDYSQQEPRWTVHFGEVRGFPMAFEAAEKYRTDPETDNHTMMAQLAEIERKPAKELFLGKCYGMGGKKLCKKLGLPTRWAIFQPRGQTLYFNTQEEAHAARAKMPDGKIWEVAGEKGQAIIDKFDARLPFVNKLAKDCEAVAKKRGYIKTLSGRRCRFPVDDAGNYDWTHKALNRLIQGTSADQTKMALVAVDAAGHFLQLQVHDELVLSVRDREEGEAVGKIMREVVQARVPFKVDVEMGPSWGEVS